MDFINLYTTNPQTIRQIVNSSNFTTHKLNEKKPEKERYIKV